MRTGGQSRQSGHRLRRYGRDRRSPRLARRSGIPIDRLPDALTGGFADSNVLREYSRATRAGEAAGIAVLVRALVDAREGHTGERYRNRFSLLLKDIAIALDLGRSTDTSTPMAALIERLYREAGHQARS